MRNLYWVLLLFCLYGQAQCFDCNKNVGQWTDDTSMDIEKLPDGVLYLGDSFSQFATGWVNKYDFDCNLQWSKTFTGLNVDVIGASSDSAGNIYLLLRNTTSTNAGMGPWLINGFSMSPGINFYKLDPAGNIIWWRHIGPAIGTRAMNIACRQNTLYVTGTFYTGLTFSPSVSFSHPYTDFPRAFVAKYDTDGTFLDAMEHGNGSEVICLSAIDGAGNTYLTYKSINYDYSKVDKIDSNLNVGWSTTLTTAQNGNNTQGIYFPYGIRFNEENQKLYLWGTMNLNVNILGNPFFVSTNNGIFQSALTEFDGATGSLTNIMRFDNNSIYSVPPISGVWMRNRGFMAERNNYLYVLTSFSQNMVFSNGTATSETYSNGNYYNDELVLFRMNLATFTPELVLQSHGVQNLNTGVDDHPGDILFNGDDLYMTATFSSKPMTINGSTINNNSGNYNTDGMLYKYNVLNAPSSGTIVIENTCLNDQTQFTLAGNYDSVTWNFGEPSSANNTSNTISPQHQYASAGTYLVTATVTCNGSSQTVQKAAVITLAPTVNAAATITACEDNPGSGMSSAFDTSQLATSLIGTQTNVSLAYYTADGTPLPSPLPHPFSNSVAHNQAILVRAFFQQNPGCYTQSTVSFSTLAKPVAPVAVSPQAFCVQQNPTLADLSATGGSVNWYDVPNGGTALSLGTALSNNTIYYAAINNGQCESQRTPVTVLVYDTPPPTGAASQSFCSFAGPTLASLAVAGSNILWYDAPAGNILPLGTPLSDGLTYYATQTENGCESTTQLAVTVTVLDSLNAQNVAYDFCDQGADGLQLVDLASLSGQIISNPQDYVFAYYVSVADAESQNAAVAANYTLSLGVNQIYVRVTSPTGCYQVVELSLKLIAAPMINLPDDIALCKNIGNVMVNAGSFDQYLWSTGATTASISVTTPGSYWVTVTENHPNVSCSFTEDFTVFISDIAQDIQIEIQEWTANDNTIVVNVDNPEQFEYSLDGVTFQVDNVFTDVPAGQYIVYVRDIDRCGTTRIEVVVLMYPKYFTPNGDGTNDFWQIKFSDAASLDIAIFDRYGRLLTRFGGNEAGWDGSVKGEPAPSTDYWFVVTKDDGVQYRGHFTLKR